MEPQKRIIVNTAAQYGRTIINVCLSLYSTRLILLALGQTDYGIYSVIAGVVAMLSFITNALVTTTQRFLSVYQGTKDKEKIYQVFGNSLLLHILIGTTLLILLCSITKPVVYSWLNIDLSRQNIAAFVYLATTVILLLSFITAPFRALFIARENIVYISVIDIADGVLKLGAAILLSNIAYDRLAVYALFMIGISMFNLFAFVIYALSRYEECHWPRWREWDNKTMSELFGFASWTVYSTGCVIARNQGVAVVLNVFLGVLVNTAYGIAQQVSGAVSFISASIINAINPQIMKAKGEGNSQRMWRLVEYESKYSFLLLAMASIPLIFEMETILQLWLGEVPAYTARFCQIILLTVLVDQVTIGLTSAIQAVGKLRKYTLIFYTIKLLTIIVIIICLRMKVDVKVSMWSFVAVEFLDALVRIPLVKSIEDFAVGTFIRNVFVRIAVPLVVMLCIAYLCTRYLPCGISRLFGTCGLTIIGGGLAILLSGLDNIERQYLKTLLKK